jgi:hypothetical protein
MKNNNKQHKDIIKTKKPHHKVRNIRRKEIKKQKGGDTPIKESSESKTFLNSMKMTNSKDSKELEKAVEGTPYYPGPMPIPDCTIL